MLCPVAGTGSVGALVHSNNEVSAQGILADRTDIRDFIIHNYTAVTSLCFMIISKKVIDALRIHLRVDVRDRQILWT